MRAQLTGLGLVSFLVAFTGEEAQAAYLQCSGPAAGGTSFNCGPPSGTATWRLLATYASSVGPQSGTAATVSVDGNTLLAPSVFATGASGTTTATFTSSSVVTVSGLDSNETLTIEVVDDSQACQIMPGTWVIAPYTPMSQNGIPQAAFYQNPNAIPELLVWNPDPGMTASNSFELLFNSDTLVASGSLTVNDAASFTYLAPDIASSNNIYVDFTDSSDPGYAWIQVVDRDTTPPTLTVSQLPQYAGGSGITVTGTTSDPNQGASVTVNGVQAQINGDGAFSATIGSFVNGSDAVQVVASDQCNNSTVWNGSVTGETSPPTVTLVSPDPSSESNGTFQFLQSEVTIVIDYAVAYGNTTINTSGLSATADVTGSPFSPASASQTSATFNFTLSDGQYTFTFSVPDALGNVGTLQVPVSVSTVPPAVTLVSPNPDTGDDGVYVVTQPYVTVTVSVADPNGPGIAWDDIYALLDYQPTQNGPSYDESAGTVTWQVGLTDTTYIFEAFVPDTAGRVSTLTITLVDNGPLPQITLLSPDAGTLVDGVYTLTQSEVTLTVGLTDTGDAGLNLGYGGVLGFLNWYELGSPSVDSSNDTATWTVDIPNGSYILEVEAFDDVGNMAVLQAELAIDAPTPTVTLVSPSSSTLQDGVYVVDQSPVTISAEFQDTDGVGLNTASITGTINSSSMGIPSLSGTTTVTATWVLTLANNSYGITISGSDNAGNVASLNNIQLQVGAPVPVIQVVNPPSSALNSNGVYVVDQSQLSLVVGVTDPNGPGVGSMISCTVDGQTTEVPFNADAGTASWNYTLSNNQYGFTISAPDVLGHTATQTIPIQLVAPAPTLTLTEPSSSNIQSGVYTTDASTFALQVQWSDSSGMGVTGVSAYANGSGGLYEPFTPTTSGNTATWSITLPNGTYDFVITVTDLDGTSAQVSLTVVVDAPPPTITQITPDPSTATDGVYSSSQSEVTIVIGYSDADGPGVDTSGIVAVCEGTEQGCGGAPYTPQINSTANTATWVIPLPDGSTSVVITVPDVDGNAATLTLPYQVNANAPGVTLVSPGSSAWNGTAYVVTDSNVALSIQWDDSWGPGVSSASDLQATGLTDIVGPTTYNLSAGTATFNLPLPNGPFTSQVTVTDNDGNAGTLSVPLLVEAPAPTVTLVTPPNSSLSGGWYVVTQSPVTVTVQFSDPDGPGVNTTCILGTLQDSTCGTVSGDEATWTLYLANGQYDFVVSVPDGYGNTASLTVPLEVESSYSSNDATPPAVTFTSPAVSTTVTSGTLAVAFTYSNPDSNAAPVESNGVVLVMSPSPTGVSSNNVTVSPLDVTPTGAATGSVSGSIDIDTLGNQVYDGTYDLVATVKDLAGNVGSASVPFTLTRGLIAPSVTVTMPVVTNGEASATQLTDTIQFTYAGGTPGSTPVLWIDGSQVPGCDADAASADQCLTYDGSTATTIWTFTEAGDHGIQAGWGTVSEAFTLDINAGQPVVFAVLPAAGTPEVQVNSLTVPILFQYSADSDFGTPSPVMTIDGTEIPSCPSDGGACVTSGGGQSAVTWTFATDGVHTISEEVTYSASYEGSGTIDVAIADTPPTVSLSCTATGCPTTWGDTTATTFPLTVSYTEDPNSNYVATITSVEVQVDPGTAQEQDFWGSPGATAQDGYGSSVITVAGLSVGAHTLLATVTDAAGNVGTATEQFSVTAGAMQILSLSPGGPTQTAPAYLTDGTPVVTVNYVDPVEALSLSMLSLTDNGMEIPYLTESLTLTGGESAGAPGSASGVVSSFAEGLHELVATASDDEGNQAAAVTTWFWIDWTAPTGSFVSFAPSPTQDTAAVIINCADSLSGLASATVALDPIVDDAAQAGPVVSLTIGGSGQCYNNELQMQPGNYELVFTLKDQAGNVYSFTQDVVAGEEPGAPTGVTATPGDAQVTVSWTAPSETGGVTISTYRVTSTSGQEATVSGSTTSHTFTGLTNGTSYTFEVGVTNSAGLSAWSTWTTPVTPSTVPGAPVITQVLAGNGEVTVTWSAPSANGAAITGYTVASSPGSFSASVGGTTLTATVTGLTNGTSYTFTVTATNADGTGGPSTASAAVVPSAVPGAPGNVQATAGNAQATVTWSAADDGGSAITQYTVTSGPGGLSTSVGGTTLTATVTGLTNGVTYTFTVTATNADGTGPGASSGGVTPVSVPGAPRNVFASGGNGESAVIWEAPESNGGVIIDYYVVTPSSGDAVVSFGAEPPASFLVAGLTNGTSYTFTVAAHNAQGMGPASWPSNAVVPQAAPGAPHSVTATAGYGQVSLAWTAPSSNGGSALTGYVVCMVGGSCSNEPLTPTSLTIGSLTDGTTYQFSVAATNADGTGPATLSNAATPVNPLSVSIGFPTASNGASSPIGCGPLGVSGTVSDTLGSAVTVTVNGTPAMVHGGQYAAVIQLTEQTSGVSCTCQCDDSTCGDVAGCDDGTACPIAQETISVVTTDAAGNSSALSTSVDVQCVFAPPAPAMIGFTNACSQNQGFMSCNARVAHFANPSTSNDTDALTLAPDPDWLGPPDFWDAYYAQLTSLTGGAGLTIGIVDVLDCPNVASDLATYRSFFKLPSCPGGASCFRKVDEDGLSTTDLAANPAGSDGNCEETTLDVEMASATCPLCNILLVEVASEDPNDLGKGIDTAVRLGAAVVSISWFAYESTAYPASFCAGPFDPSCEEFWGVPPVSPPEGPDAGNPNMALLQLDNQYLNHPGVAIFSAAGDHGLGSTGWPASSPFVTAVGETGLSRPVRDVAAWAPLCSAETNCDDSFGGFCEFGPECPGTVGGASAVISACPAGAPSTGVLTGATRPGFSKPWFDSAANWVAGDGCSRIEPKPDWQSDNGCGRKMLADIGAAGAGMTFNALDAGPLDPPNTMFLGNIAIFDSYDSPGFGWQVVGGSSAASPLVAGIFASTGNAHTDPSYSYENPDEFFDIASDFPGGLLSPWCQTSMNPFLSPSTPGYFCHAGPLYDGPTGNGVPNALAMVGAGHQNAEFFSTGDFNGDGLTDWVWYARPGFFPSDAFGVTGDAFIVMLSDPANPGSFTTALTPTAALGDLSQCMFFTVADFNDDGYADWSCYAPPWMYGAGNELLMIWLSNGNGTATWYPTSAASVAGGNWVDAKFFTAGNFTGEGLGAGWSFYAPPSLLPGLSNQFVVLTSNGTEAIKANNAFTVNTQDTSGWGDWSGAQFFTTGDFNGDGMTDWSWYAPWSNDFIIMLSTGFYFDWANSTSGPMDNSFVPFEIDTSLTSATAPWGDWTGATWFATGDFNGDGMTDWSWYNGFSPGVEQQTLGTTATPANEMVVMLSSGCSWGAWENEHPCHQTFTPSYVNVSTLTVSSSGAPFIPNTTTNNLLGGQFLTTGDFDGDGKTDWAFFAPWQGTFDILFTHEPETLLVQSPVPGAGSGTALWNNISPVPWGGAGVEASPAQAKYFTSGHFFQTGSGSTQTDWSFYSPPQAAVGANNFVVVHFDNAGGTNASDVFTTPTNTGSCVSSQCSPNWGKW